MQNNKSTLLIVPYSAIRRTRVTLLSPSRFQYYPGMFSGYVEGVYSLDEIRIDLASLSQTAKIKWIEGHARQVNPEQNVLETDKGARLPFDIISFNIGSMTAGVDSPGVEEFGHVIKPNYLLPEVLEQIKTHRNVVIVGGGAAGIEMSLALQAWHERNQMDTHIKLVSAGPLLQPEGRSVSREIEAIVKKKGVETHLNQIVNEVAHGKLTSSERTIAFDTLLWLAGPRPHPIFRQSGLPVDQHGYLLVEDTLQTAKYPHVFGIGDCITLASHPGLPKAGVYAVRQAPTLWRNLKDYIQGKVLDEYRPQRTILSILSTGQKEAFLLYKGRSFHGRWARRLKRQIDRDFVRRYQP